MKPVNSHRLTSLDFLRMKQSSEKISMLTCYDYPTAVLEDNAGIDVILVGDSLGTNVLGYQSETEVTLGDIVHHLRAVRRGVTSAFLLADMPHLTYTTPEEALATAAVLTQAGADGVKFEGGYPEIARALVAEGYNVCAHLGLLPQTHIQKSLQGKTAAEAARILNEAQALVDAGVFMMVLELVPEPLAGAISRQLPIPMIGIGAGRLTDGQVLIVNDMLGINERELRHSKSYGRLHGSMEQAFKEYSADVKAGRFPELTHSRRMSKEELSAFQLWLESAGSRTDD